MADMLLHTQTLLKLNLSMNGIGVRGTEAIANALQSNTVSIILFLSLIFMFYNQTLAVLSLKGNRILSEGAQYLANALEMNKVVLSSFSTSKYLL